MKKANSFRESFGYAWRGFRHCLTHERNFRVHTVMGLIALCLGLLLKLSAGEMAVLLLVRAGIGVHPDKIMIGNFMLVIPGIQLTTSLRDMINGDTISGLLNLSEAVLKAISVALGFSLVLLAGGV